MRRVIEPLERMGARIEAREANFAPLEIRGSPLQSIQYTLPVASAQVKSAVLLAGLFADGETSVEEPVATRDHTEVALREFGADVRRVGHVVAVIRPARTDSKLASRQWSRAIFLRRYFSSAAALVLPGSHIRRHSQRRLESDFAPGCSMSSAAGERR